MIHLLVATPSHSIHGGVERIIESLGRGLPAHGFRVTVGLASGSRWHLPDRFRKEYPGLETVDVDGTDGTAEGRRRGIGDVLDRLRPDVVLIARMFDAYEVVRERKQRGDPIRLATTVQAYEWEYIADLATYGAWVDACATSGRLVAAAIRHFTPLTEDRVVSIPGGVRAADRFAEREAHRPIRLGYVGRISSEQKRVLDLADTLVRLRGLDLPFTCRIVGVGPAEEELRSAIRNAGLDDRVTFEGWRTPDALYSQVYPELDVLLHFAAWEGITIAPREAMAHGVVPVVSRFLGLGFEGHFRDGDNCRTFDVGDTETAAGHVKKLAEDPGQWTRLSLAARRSQSGEWSDEGALATWARVLRNAVERPPAIGVAAHMTATAPSGRLARLIGESSAAAVRRILGRRVLHAGPGDEWPHTGSLSAPGIQAEIMEFAVRADRDSSAAQRSG